ncbi:MAG: queuosine precursor transporter [bacterium]|nr:queuosine precursor transporter [bacterium]
MKKTATLEIIAGLFVAVLIISNIVSVKILRLGFLTFDGGTIIFPLTYIFGDILTEVFGYEKSRKIIWVGFFSCVLMSLTFFIVGILPSDADWRLQQSYSDILGMVPRIVIASLIAYLFGEFSNSIVLSKMKIKTKGRLLFLRTIASTLVGQIFDTGLFVLIAFAGIYEPKLLISIALSNYIFKVFVEAAMTPVTYLAVNYLKKHEDSDVFDNGISYNPFRLFESSSD